MNNPKVEAYCESIDNVFLDYMTNRCNSVELCKRLTINLNSISRELGITKDFNVILINGKNDFCGIKVYPDAKGLSSMLNELDATSLTSFCKGWLVNIHEYTIEIDENCFDKQKLNFTNKELTAILLHELGHVAFSSSIAETIYNSYMIHREELKYGKKSIVRMAQQIFYSIPVMIACGAHVIRTGIDGRKEEYIADQIFGITTYKPYLYSAIDKIIRTYGTSIYHSKNDNNKIVDNLIAQNNININELATRRRLIRDDFLYQSANTHSKTLRKTYIDAMKRIGIGFADRYTNAMIATESLMDSIDSGEIKLNGILNKIKFVDTNMETATVIESAFKGAKECCCECKFAPKIPTEYDIEMVSLSIDKIHSNIDKLSVLDELYKLQENLTLYSDYTRQKNIYDINKFKIDRCAKNISDLIDTVKSKEVTVTKLSEFLEYPSDYSE